MRTWIILGVVGVIGCSGAGEQLAFEEQLANADAGSSTGEGAGGGDPVLGGGGVLDASTSSTTTGTGGQGGGASSTASTSTAGGGGDNGDCNAAAACAPGTCGVVATPCGNVDCDACALPEMCGDNGVENRCGFECLDQYAPNCANAGMPSGWGVRHGCAQPYRVAGSGFELRAGGVDACVYLYVNALQQYECCP